MTLHANQLVPAWTSPTPHPSLSTPPPFSLHRRAQGLAWKFSAETLSILVIELIVAGVALQKTQRFTHAIFVLALFPISIVFVAVLEGMGFD